MRLIYGIFLFILGACFGSFLCCQARRQHLKETKSKKLGNRSVCLHCNKQLKWYDNLPIISWLLLRGKCRYCQRKIGVAEFVSEVCTALAFVLTGINFDIFNPDPLSWIILIITFVFVTILCFLAIYDGLYGELPSIVLISAIILSVIILVFNEVNYLAQHPFSLDLVWKPVLSAFILGGLYLILYVVSKGRWVGDGDWILGLSIAMAIHEPLLALFVLFVANLAACLVMAPFIKKGHSKKIYLGPFLVGAYILVSSCSGFLLSLI